MLKMPNRIYISGGITDVPGYMEHFEKAEKLLTGYFSNRVVNPAKVLAKLPAGTSWQEYMDASMEMLKTCNCIYMLDGWQESKGAKLEHSYAKDSNYEIYYES